MRRENSDVKTAFVSEAGSLLDNRDYFAYTELDDRACYVIADGLDEDDQQRSAEMAAKIILENFMEKPSLSRWRIRRWLKEAHETLKFESRRMRLKASLLVIVTDYTKYVCASSGNARLLHLRNGRLLVKSHDQSLAQLMADRGKLAPDKVYHHEESSNLMEYIGKPEQFGMSFIRKTRMMDGDVLLLTTAGLWKGLDQSEIADALAESQDPQTFADTLEDVLLSKQAYHYDNYTAAALYINKVYQDDPKKKMRIIRRILIAVLVFCVLGGGVWWATYRSIERKAEAAANLVEYQQTGDQYTQQGDYEKALKSYSEARNAAIKIRDRLHRATLGDKMKIAQSLVDGDGYLKQKEYDQAITSYKAARQQAENYPIFSQTDIQKRLDQTEAFENVNETVQQADLKFQSGEYSAAKKLYEQANKEATQVAYTDAQKDVTTKLNDTQAKLDEIQQQTQELRAEKQEKRGDKALDAGNYELAVTAYDDAQGIYQDIDKLEKVLSIERKISKVEEQQDKRAEAAIAAQNQAAQQNAAMNNMLPPASSNNETTGTLNGTGTTAASQGTSKPAQESNSTDSTGITDSGVANGS